MTFLIGWVLKALLGLGIKSDTAAKIARPVLIGAGVVALITGLGVAKCVYDRNLIAAHDQDIAAKLAPVIRKADDNAAGARVQDQLTIANDQQEETHALAPLPDAHLSDRQRARACAILLRQSREARGPAPAGC